MGRRLALPDFGPAPERRPVADAPAMTSETQRLDAYEHGYAAGWEDAVRNASEESNRIAAGLAAQLQDLSFSYHEARAHILAGLGPLLGEVATKLLPMVAAEGLPALVTERIEAAVRAGIDRPVQLNVAAADHDRIVALLPRDPGFPLEVKVRDTLAEGQVHLTAGGSETEIDLSGTVAEIQAAIRDFFTLETAQERERRHA